VLGGAAVVIGLVMYVRFSGALSLPAKPAPPTGPSGTQRQLLTKGASSSGMYGGYLQSDAATAGVRAPTVEDMARKFAYRVDEGRHVLEPGKPAIEVAGVRLHLERSGDAVLLAIKNLLDNDIAYEVTSQSTAGAVDCEATRAIPHNAMVIAKAGTETRTECKWHDGMAIAITKVETMEVPPLSAWYLGQLPPQVVGIEERIARSHHGVETNEKCTAILSQVVRTGMDRGEIAWRDLVDFYARHRCQTYRFPSTYRAFKTDGERNVPAVDGAM